ncbi:MAG TPA: LPS export ABC transporter periplasmic protein LptC, partial [Xanthomonadaceae bacterium]|nr:LPS export ABC transporter periplasmic protein LptC [Xanthomonadaceae bacterium]
LVTITTALFLVPLIGWALAVQNPETPYVVLLLLGALATGWSVWHHRVKPTATGPGGGRSDYVLHDFELVALDDQGQESFTLRAPRLQQTPGARTMDLAQPLFLLPDENGHYWQVRARTGWVSAGREHIRLTGAVLGTSPPEDPHKVALRTEQLNVFPDRHHASTQAVVTVTQPGSILRGRGLEVALDTRRYEFLSQVRSHYVPTSR